MAGRKRLWFVEFSLRDHNNLEQLMIQFNLVELNGVKGNWQLDVPVDLLENSRLTKMADLKDATAVHHGVEINLKKLQMAPSSMELYFETAFTKEEREKYEEAIREFEEKFGESSMDNLVSRTRSAIAYHIKNSEDEVIYSTSHSLVSGTTGMLRWIGEEMDKFGHTTWTHLFIPKIENQLTFVLEGVYKRETTDLSLTIKPKEINKHPLTLDYKGNHLKVTSVRKPESGQEKFVIINLEGRINTLNSDLGNWIAVDDKGNSYTANFNFNGSFTEGQLDKNGRRARLALELEGLTKVPEELTLYLVSMSFYYPVEKEWEVQLLGEH